MTGMEPSGTDTILVDTTMDYQQNPSTPVSPCPTRAYLCSGTSHHFSLPLLWRGIVLVAVQTAHLPSDRFLRPQCATQTCGDWWVTGLEQTVLVFLPRDWTYLADLPLPIVWYNLVSIVGPATHGHPPQ